MKTIYCILLATVMSVCTNAQSKVTKSDHYLFPEFTHGKVLLKTGKVDAKLLNYNTLTEQLVFDDQGRVLAVPKEQMRRIDTVFISERKFIIMNDKFVELLHHSAWDLYAEYKCNLQEKGKDVGYGGTSETSAINTPAAINLGGNIYNMELPDGYETKRYFFYWLRKSGELTQFVNVKQLRKLYSNKKDEFSDYVKQHDVKYEDQASVIELIDQLESN